MANGYFERGEIYWVRVDGGWGSETGVGRPGLIITNDRVNVAVDCVTIAWMTTQPKDKPWDILTFATGKKSYVMCNNINTVDKTRLGKCIGKLPPEEMKQVEDALENQFDLGYVDDTALKEKETEIAALEAEKTELRAEIADLKAMLEAKEDDKTAHEVELAMWQKLYEKALGTVVDMKFGFDMNRREEQKKPVAPKKVEAPKKPEPKKQEESVVEEPAKVDVNSCSFTDLKRCGLNAEMALKVIDGRPYKGLDDVKSIPGITNVMWAILVHKICVVPVKVAETPKVVEEPKKVEEPKTPEEPKKRGPRKSTEALSSWDGVKINVNEVETASELNTKTGLNMKACMEIIRHREQFGDYEKLADLTNLKWFGDITLKRYGHMLEV